MINFNHKLINFILSIGGILLFMMQTLIVGFCYFAVMMLIITMVAGLTTLSFESELTLLLLGLFFSWGGWFVMHIGQERFYAENKDN